MSQGAKGASQAIRANRSASRIQRLNGARRSSVRSNTAAANRLMVGVTAGFDRTG
jgi:hypothetical protein